MWMQDYFLSYKGKEDELSIIENTEKSKLHEIEIFKGKSNIDGWINDWHNLLFCGDNLPIMKSLLKKYQGQITLIYIDPPFSTNQIFKSGVGRTSTISSSQTDEIAYHDILIGADFIEFLRKRIIFLKELMSENGSIYVHIDGKKGHYIKCIMDEIFGETNFRNDIARIKCKPKNFDRKGFGNVKDMILFYSKTDDFVWHESKEILSLTDVEKLYPKVSSNGRRYTTVPVHAPGETRNGATGQQWKGSSPPKGRHWRSSPDELTKLDEAGLIEWSSNGNPRKINFADDAIKRGKKRQDIWTFIDPQYPKYPTEKNYELLDTIIKASSNSKDIVMDCFCGSGTTLERAELLGRHWIGIDNSKRAIQETTTKLKNIENCSPWKLCSSDKQMKL